MLKNNNFIAGLGLIFLGIAYLLRNFNISMINTIMMLAGLYFIYSAVIKKHQPHLLFGIVLTTTGAIMVMRDLRVFRFNITGELFLLLLGVIFLAVYFRKGILGFVFPGYILPAISIYSLIENNINDNFIWPSFFILLGLAFYMIYFTAYVHKSSWPLIPGTILILFGLGAFAVVLGLVSLDMISGLMNYQSYILSAAVILVGIVLLYRSIRSK